MSDSRRETFDDAALSALLDDALPDDEAARLRERLAREPQLTARLAALEEANAAVRDAYSGVVDEPLPERVLELLAPAERSDDVVALRGRRRRTPFALPPTARDGGSPANGARNLRPMALAASIALAVGLGLGALAASKWIASDPATALVAAGTVAPGTALHDLLETAPSAAPRALGGYGVAGAPLFTFAAVDGGYCRQIELTDSRTATTAVACRRDGDWRVELAAFAPRTPGPDGVYRPAARAPTAVDAAVDALIDGDPLSVEAESALLARGWSSD